MKWSTPKTYHFLLVWVLLSLQVLCSIIITAVIKQYLNYFVYAISFNRWWYIVCAFTLAVFISIFSWFLIERAKNSMRNIFSLLFTFQTCNFSFLVVEKNPQTSIYKNSQIPADFIYKKIFAWWANNKNVLKFFSWMDIE